MDDNRPGSSSNLIDNYGDDAESSTSNLSIDNWNSETEEGSEEASSSIVGFIHQDDRTTELFNDVITLEFPKFSKLQESDIEEFLRKYIYEDLKQGRFPSQWTVRINNIENREKLLRIWKTKIKNKTCWIKPYYDYELRGFIKWLPHFISDDDVKTQLCQFGEVQFLINEVHEVWEGEIMSEVKYFGLLLKDNMVKNDLPHFLKFSGYRALVIVRGRQPACFHCREFGHSKRDCRTYKEKLKDYCENPTPGKPRWKPRGRRHRPDNGDKHDSEEKPQNETDSNLISTIPTEPNPKRTHSTTEQISSTKSTDQKETEILDILRSLNEWGKETIEMAKQTLKAIEDNIKMNLTSSDMTEPEAKESIEVRIKITELLAEMRKTTIQMIEQTLNSLKNMVTEHFGLDSDDYSEHY